MRKNVFFCILFFGFIAFSGNAQTSNDIQQLVGTWVGSYGANQGETGLTVTVFRETDHYRAIFHFYNLPGRTNVRAEGRYYMDVLYNWSNGMFVLRGSAWIDRPPNFGFAHLSGRMNENTFSGIVASDTNNNIGAFRLIRE